MLSPGEAHALAEATKNVQRHYDFLANASEKAVDWGNLIVVCAALYGGKFGAMRARRRGETAPRDVTHSAPANGAPPQPGGPIFGSPEVSGTMAAAEDLFPVEVPGAAAGEVLH